MSAREVCLVDQSRRPGSGGAVKGQLVAENLAAAEIGTSTQQSQEPSKTGDVGRFKVFWKVVVALHLGSRLQDFLQRGLFRSFTYVHAQRTQPSVSSCAEAPATASAELLRPSTEAPESGRRP
jgi:hypothetical protein